MNYFRSNFQQLQANGIDPLFPHVSRQRQSPEPVEQIVGKHMNLQAVCINRHGVGTHGRKVESAFSFLNEVLHLAPATVILNNLIRLQVFQRSDNKSEHVHHLAIRFFHFEDDSSWMGPASGLIIEFAVFDGVVELVLSGCPVKGFFRILCIPDQGGILFQADRILAVVFFTSLIQIWRGKTAVSS